MPQENERLRKVWKQIQMEAAAAEIAGTPISHGKLNKRARALSEGAVNSLAQLEVEAGVHINDSMLTQQTNRIKPKKGKKTVSQAALVEYEALQAAGEEIPEGLQKVAKEYEKLSIPQNVALFGSGAAYGQTPRIAGAGAAVGAMLPGGETPQEAYSRAHDVNAQYMQEARQQNPPAAAAQENFGQLASMAASMGTMGKLGAASGGGGAMGGPTGFPGTLRWGGGAGGLGQGGLSGGGGSLRWAGIPPALAAVIQKLPAKRQERVLQQIEAQRGRELSQQDLTMPQDATAVRQPPRQGPANSTLPGMPQGLSDAAMSYIQQPEVIAQLEERAQQVAQTGQLSERMGGPGPNVAGNAGPGVVAGPMAQTGKGLMDFLPGAPGDVAALGDVARDVAEDEVGIGTGLALLSLAPFIPNMKPLVKAARIKALRNDIRALRRANPNLADDVDMLTEWLDEAVESDKTIGELNQIKREIRELTEQGRDGWKRMRPLASGDSSYDIAVPTVPYRYATPEERLAVIERYAPDVTVRTKDELRQLNHGRLAIGPRTPADMSARQAYSRAQKLAFIERYAPERLREVRRFIPEGGKMPVNDVEVEFPMQSPLNRMTGRDPNRMGGETAKVREQMLESTRLSHPELDEAGVKAYVDKHYHFGVPQSGDLQPPSLLTGDKGRIKDLDEVYKQVEKDVKRRAARGEFD